MQRLCRGFPARVISLCVLRLNSAGSCRSPHLGLVFKTTVFNYKSQISPSGLMNVWKCTERRRQRAAGPSCLSQGALQAVLSCLVEIQPRVGSHGVAHGLQDGRQEGNALTGSFPMQDFCFSVLYAHKNKEKQIFRTDQILSCFLTCFILISSELTVSFTVASSKCVLGLRCCLALSGAYP